MSVLSGDMLDGTFEPLVLSLDEYIVRVLGLFGDTLGVIMGSPLRFFAVFGVVWVALSLFAYLVRAGKALSK